MSYLRNEKYLHLTVYENKYDNEKTYGKLSYLNVDSNGNVIGDGKPHNRRVEIYELDRVIDEFMRQTHMSEYQLDRDGYIVNLDYHRTKGSERKQKVIDKLSGKQSKPVRNQGMASQNYTPRGVVKNLQVQEDNARKYLDRGIIIATVVASLFVAGKIYSALTEDHTRIADFHKVDGQINKNESIVINGILRAEAIVSKLVKEKYHQVSDSDIGFLVEFYTALSQANHDENNNFFRQNIYRLFEKNLNGKEKYVFNKLESLSNDIYQTTGASERYTYNQEAVYKYLLYAMTLVSGGENSYPYESMQKSRDIASVTEGNVFVFMKPEYKLPILINLRETLSKTDLDFGKLNLGYNIYKIESYQFNKAEFIQKLDDAILLVRTQLESMNDVKTGRK